VSSERIESSVPPRRSAEIKNLAHPAHSEAANSARSAGQVRFARSARSNFRPAMPSKGPQHKASPTLSNRSTSRASQNSPALPKSASRNLPIIQEMLSARLLLHRLLRATSLQRRRNVSRSRTCGTHHGTFSAAPTSSLFLRRKFPSLQHKRPLAEANRQRPRLHRRMGIRVPCYSISSPHLLCSPPCSPPTSVIFLTI